VPFPVTLKWNRDGLAPRYHVEVDSTKAFASPLFKNESVTDTSIQLASLPWATRYYWRARGANNTGSGNWSEIRYFTPLGSTVSVHDVAAESPREFLLEQNYPNPFNPTTAISFQLSANSYVTLSVFDVLGREVAVLVNGEKPGGVYRITWDASSLPSGIYVYRLQARHSSGGQVGQFTHSKKLILLK
ncbi:MAG: T9SS type A sorting domain-containing protein, partial [Bacteroidota bacterium]